MHFEEWVIVSYVQIHPTSLTNDMEARVEATRSSVKFLIVENECMAKELQAARQGEEESTRSTKAEMKKGILSNVSALETVIWRLYDMFVTVNKEIFHLHGH